MENVDSVDAQTNSPINPMSEKPGHLMGPQVHVLDMLQDFFSFLARIFFRGQKSSKKCLLKTHETPLPSP